jgi:hypothetical protein
MARSHRIAQNVVVIGSFLVAIAAAEVFFIPGHYIWPSEPNWSSPPPGIGEHQQDVIRWCNANGLPFGVGDASSDKSVNSDVRVPGCRRLVVAECQWRSGLIQTTRVMMYFYLDSQDKVLLVERRDDILTL